MLHVKSKAAGDPRVFAVGFSAGSGSVTKYVSEKAGDCVLNGAVSVANGYSVRTGMAWVHKKTWMLERCASFEPLTLPSVWAIPCSQLLPM